MSSRSRFARRSPCVFGAQSRSLDRVFSHRILVLDEDVVAGEDRVGVRRRTAHLDPGDLGVLLLAGLEDDQLGAGAEGDEDGAGVHDGAEAAAAHPAAAAAAATAATGAAGARARARRCAATTSTAAACLQVLGPDLFAVGRVEAVERVGAGQAVDL